MLFLTRRIVFLPGAGPSVRNTSGYLNGSGRWDVRQFHCSPRQPVLKYGPDYWGSSGSVQYLSRELTGRTSPGLPSGLLLQCCSPRCFAGKQPERSWFIADHVRRQRKRRFFCNGAVSRRPVFMREWHQGSVPGCNTGSAAGGSGCCVQLRLSEWGWMSPISGQ